MLPLHVMDRGSGPAVLLVHGFTGSSRAWGKEIIHGLTEAGRRVLAVDLPGHGRSATPDDLERYALHRVAADLEAVLERKGLTRADWIGYSMGGRIALGAAVLRPHPVGRLVLEGASPGIADPDAAADRKRADEALADRILADGLERFVDDWMAKPVFHTQQRRLPEARLDQERERRLHCDPVGLARTLRGLGTGHQPSFWHRLDEIGAPTLLITGAEDEKFTRTATRMVKRIPDASHLAVPEAGHTVHLERPGAWLDAVTAFLDRSGPGRQRRGASPRQTR